MNDLSATLSDLIDACRKSEDGFAQAALNVGDDPLRLRFTTHALERATFADELATHLQQNGGHLQERVRREVELTPDSKAEPVVLAEREGAEETLLSRYERALTMELPAAPRAVAERQRLAVQETIFELRNMENGRKATAHEENHEAQGADNQGGTRLDNTGPR